MSVLLAAGWARSRSHAVSVVPMIQKSPHGITNSTDFSVLVMKPHSERIRSLGTTMWMPLLASTSSCARPPIRSWTSSVQTPAALMTTLARISRSRWPSRSRARTPTTRLAVAQEAGDLGAGRDVGAVVGGGAGDGHHQPRVVDLAVVVADRAVEVVGLMSGAIRASCLRKTCLCLGTPMSYLPVIAMPS